MKLRIKNNGIRYRLTKTDVTNLAKHGVIKETVNFGDTELVYVLKNTVNEALSVDFKNSVITMYISRIMIAQLADTDRVGFENNHGELQLLIEKDFTCLDNVMEDQSDNYPNPLANK